jgi:NAD(P)H-dependent flavin oxidoreductase YrpB (nitropropane dioxygenase family)
MTTFQEIFKVKYPIACMAMNRVSDLKLAIAVRKAGGLPSYSAFNYYIAPDQINPKLFNDDVTAYVNEFGDANILISLSVADLINPEIFKILVDNQVSAVEIIFADVAGEPEDTEIMKASAVEKIKAIQQYNGLVFTKAVTMYDTFLSNIDGIILKGPDGAGRGNDQKVPLEQLFDTVRSKHPNLKVIVAGGIGTSSQVKYYMDRGAFGVGLGTLFAATLESKISMEAKEKLVSAKAADLKNLAGGAQQLALVFNEVAKDNFNNTWGLVAGIKTATTGHVFAGRGIEHINAILPVSDVMSALVSEL